ncbi:MAG: CDP-alcohol phosphatidyltransferase family protein [Nitrospina sp.]|jgi:1L-myo-inositol 1-phosphate cytidylyltransferase / CDP-L-myo-inositol myo-inositolphosphotransferase|nr:CDP-alcohol phosphatidyltransferase family protein [Nitrospina sp.]
MGSSQLAVVLLSPPESGYSLLLKNKIAGVSLFKRLILTLQKAGVNDILVLSHLLDEQEIKTCQADIEKDSRFKSRMNWQDRTSFFEANSDGKANVVTPSQPFLLVNGNLVTHQKVIQGFREAISSKNPNGIFCLALESEKPGGLYLLPASKFSTLSHGIGSESGEYKVERVVLSADKNFWVEVCDNSSASAAEEHLLNSVGLNNDSLMDRLVTRFFSRQFTRLFLKTALTPNQITFLSLLVGIGSAWCFYLGTYFSGITGSILLLVSAWIDCTDGEIARLKFMETSWGARLDIICDNIVHCFVFFAIGMGLFFATGDPLYKLYGGLAVFGSLVSFMILNGVIVKKKQAAGEGKKLEASLVDQIANRDFTYFLLVMACIGRLDIFIILTAIGSNVFAIYLMIQRKGLEQ